MIGGKYCHKCKKNVDVASIHGSTICKMCGTELSQGDLVSDLNFTESKSGAVQIVGKRVSSSDSQQSRRRTLEQARQRMETVADKLHLGDVQLNTACRFYNIALTSRQTYGRPGDLTRAVCLYAACRHHKTAHLLLDVAWATDVDVFALARTYLRFCKDNSLSHPAVDPALYVPRVLARLSITSSDDGFTSPVPTQTAKQIAGLSVRLCNVMRRDWIEVGRRPVGVTGAAVFAAARCFGVFRTPDEVAAACNIAPSTLMHRVSELAASAAGSMVVGELCTAPETTLRELGRRLPASYARRTDINDGAKRASVSAGARFERQQDAALLAGIETRVVDEFNLAEGLAPEAAAAAVPAGAQVSADAVPLVDVSAFVIPEDSLELEQREAAWQPVDAAFRAVERARSMRQLRSRPRTEHPLAASAAESAAALRVPGVQEGLGALEELQAGAARAAPELETRPYEAVTAEQEREYELEFENNYDINDYLG